MCYFPVSDRLAQSVRDDDIIHDDDIAHQDVMRYVKGRAHNIYILSIAVDPMYQKTSAMKMLAHAFRSDLAARDACGCAIAFLQATAVSNAGRRTLERFGLKAAQKHQRRPIPYTKQITVLFVKAEIMKRYRADLILFTLIFLKAPRFQKKSSRILRRKNILRPAIRFWVTNVSLSRFRFEAHVSWARMIACASDSVMHAKERHQEEAMLFIVYSCVTKLALIEAVFTDMRSPLTYMLEEMYRGNGRVVTEDGEVAFDAYFQTTCALQRCGAMKHFSSLSETPPDKDELMYILMAEEYGTQDIDSKLRANPMIDFENISQYEAFDLYASNAGVTLIFKQWEESCAGVGILRRRRAGCELILYKIAAVTRTNRQAVEKLECESYPSLKVIDELSSQFARTIRFWDTDNFHYLTTRNMARKIAQAFESDAAMQEYMRNLSFLEHLISLRSAQANERENKILNFRAIV
jgi:hypothetical protein